MKTIIISFVGVLTIFCTVYSQANIKWEETFYGTGTPPGWITVDSDGSGTGLELVQSITLENGTTVLPQADQNFWSSNYQNANVSGMIDEWLITPQISVIYAGDSLYFWAGASGGLFADSLRVWVSTTNNQLASFTYLLGYFKVDGPAGSWHKYGFDLSPFDGSDIYIAVNYYIRDGGPGGRNSSSVWIDHFVVTGDPSTFNIPPTPVALLEPPDTTLLHPQADTTIYFKWSASMDPNEESVKYILKILDIFPPLIFDNITDTTFALNWQGLLNNWSIYRWTVNVTDGKSTVASPDTFLFITPPIENLAPFAFSLLSPPDKDTVAVTDTIRFRWYPAVDPNSDTLSYALRIFGNELDTTFVNISNTAYDLIGSGILEYGSTYQWRVKASDSQFSTPSKETRSFITRSLTNLTDSEDQIPQQFVLHQNYPNPFNPITIIKYYIPKSTYVTLKVYDITGQLVATLVNAPKTAGSHSVTWNAENLSSGVYFYRITAGDFSDVKKAMVLK